MVSVSRKTKKALFEALIKESNTFGDPTQSDSLLKFTESIWDLESLPSQDPRFRNAYDDIYQHTVNNDDWSIEYLFVERLRLLDSENLIFINFIEHITSPEIRETEDEIIRFVIFINSFLEKEGLALILSDYDEDNLPIYRVIQRSDSGGNLFDLKENDIPFFVVKEPNGRSDRIRSQDSPQEFPAFVLVFNDGWNDYGYRTEFNLYFYDAIQKAHSIGEIKIIFNDEFNTANVIPNKFVKLEDGFASLGQEIDYYLKLKENLNRNFESVLFALRDSAFFPDFTEGLESKTSYTSSLIRYDTAERILREAKYQVYDYDLSNLYSFKYNFTPPYSDTSVEIGFEFDSENEIPSRIYAVIGKNGTGKTKFITSLPSDISQKKIKNFSPRTPLFSKVIAVSYSIFDKFEIPKKTASFNYVYCGIRNENNEEISERSRVAKFHNSWKKIQKLERMDKWRSILLNFMETDIVATFIKEIEKPDSTDTSYTVDLRGFNKVKGTLSSGQNIILYIISEIVANIRYDSLLLFDEPETHLHPNAITQLMNTIYELVNEFKSFCIITTHSPLIVRELLSRNVYVMERHVNTPSVRKIGIESFGENLTAITEEVFGNKEVPKQYKMLIEKWKLQGKTYSDIIEIIQSDDIPVSLNTRIYVKSIFGDTDE